MKKLLGFFTGMIVGLLVVLIIFRNTTQVAAGSGSNTAPDESGSTAVSTDGSGSALSGSTDLNSLMPDVKKICNSALGAPYRQVESEITDPDIAGFFRTYMYETGLDKVGLDR